MGAKFRGTNRAPGGGLGGLRRQKMKTEHQIDEGFKRHVRELLNDRKVKNITQYGSESWINSSISQEEA
jgi:hypothetical protein